MKNIVLTLCALVGACGGSEPGKDLDLSAEPETAEDGTCVPCLYGCDEDGRCKPKPFSWPKPDKPPPPHIPPYPNN